MSYACTWARTRFENFQCIHCGLQTCSVRLRMCRNQEQHVDRQPYNQIAIHKIVSSAKPRNHFECIHISEGPFDDGLVEADPGCGCPNYGPMTSVFECAVHGECTPAGKAKDGSIMACKDCNHYLHKDSDDAKAT